MLEDHLDAAITRRRLRAGPAAAHVDAFADWLHAQGYKRRTIKERLLYLALWTDWLQDAGLAGEDFLTAFDAYKAALLSVATQIDGDRRLPDHGS